MTDKYKNKFRIESTRLQNWDYRWAGAYFITIVTQNREHYFGDIVETPKLGVSADTAMQLSPIGEIAQKYWNEIPQHFPFVKLGAFIIMPNHIHGIIIIKKSENDVNVVETPNLGVSTNTENHNNPNRRTIAASKKWKSGSLGVIINQYKRIITINARKIHSDFAWQTRFHEHIIRNEKSFNKITEYIINNPENWDKDKLYKQI